MGRQKSRRGLKTQAHTPENGAYARKNSVFRYKTQARGRFSGHMGVKTAFFAVFTQKAA